MNPDKISTVVYSSLLEDTLKSLISQKNLFINNSDTSRDLIFIGDIDTNTKFAKDNIDVLNQLLELKSMNTKYLHLIFK